IRAERIVGRPLGTRDFPRQTRRLSDQVDDPDWLAGAFRQRDIVAEPVLQAIGEMQLAVEYHAGEDLTAKRLADGADAKHRVGVGLLASVITDAAKTGESRLAVARRDKDKAGDLGGEVGEGACKFDRLVEQLVVGGHSFIRNELYCNNRNNAADTN